MKKTKSHISRKNLELTNSLIYQPNRITYAQHDFTLIQERILYTVIYLLQKPIQSAFSGHDYRQLDLFSNQNSSEIILEIPLSSIAKKQQYPKVRESCKQLAGLVVTIPYLDQKNNQNRIKYTGLFKIDMPVRYERSSMLRILIDKQVAESLIKLDLNDKGKPMNYTRFIYEVTLKAKNKYTPRIYTLLCCWREKGRFLISLSDFRLLMGIENKYQYYRDIRKNILEPVQEELIRINADCWFDCNDFSFTNKKKNTVTDLLFQVITPESQKNTEKLRDYARHLIKIHFNLDDNSFCRINKVIHNSNPNDLISKVEYLKGYIQNNKDSIENINEYVIMSLKNAFNGS